MTTIAPNPRIVRDVDQEAYDRAEAHRIRRRRIEASITPHPCERCGTVTHPRQLVNVSRSPYPRWVCPGCQWEATA